MDFFFLLILAGAAIAEDVILSCAVMAPATSMADFLTVAAN